MPENTHKLSRKAKELLPRHQLELIEELGSRALDLLTPAEAATEMGVDRSRIPDLIRQGWLAPAPGKNIGSAHQYYRWRVEFVKRYRSRYKKKRATKR